jgi:hypothetical protein
MTCTRSAPIGIRPFSSLDTKPVAIPTSAANSTCPMPVARRMHRMRFAVSAMLSPTTSRGPSRCPTPRRHRSRPGPHRQAGTRQSESRRRRGRRRAQSQTAGATLSESHDLSDEHVGDLTVGTQRPSKYPLLTLEQRIVGRGEANLPAASLTVSTTLEARALEDTFVRSVTAAWWSVPGSKRDPLL